MDYRKPRSLWQSHGKKRLKIKGQKDYRIRQKKKADLTKLQDLQSNRNSLSKEIGKLKNSGQDYSELKNKVDDVNKEILNLETLIGDEKDSTLYNILITTDNILQDCVPFGEDDNNNVVVKKFSEPTKFDFEPKAHYELGENLGQMDFEQTAKLCGSRSTALFDGLAKLERALSNFLRYCWEIWL